MTAPTLARTAHWLLRSHDALEELRHKGTPRPWKQTDPTPEQRDQQAARDREERANRTGPPMPETPAPLHLDILDQLIHQQQQARQAAAQIAHTLGHTTMYVQLTRQQDAPTVDTITYIGSAAEELDPIGDAELLATTTSALEQLQQAAAAHLNETTEGQRLKTACPWCLQEHLYIRTIGPEAHREPVIRCESGVCDPGPDDCGTYYFGQPCWPFHEWEWLARIMDWAND